MTTLAIKDLPLLLDGSIDIGENALLACTCTLDVAPSWLIDSLCARLCTTTSKNDDNNLKVLLITFAEDTAVHMRNLKRFGLSTPADNFQLLDLSSRLYSLDLKPTPLENLLDQIRLAVGHGSPSMPANSNIVPINSTASAANTRYTVILNNPDLLMASGFYKWTQLTNFITDVRKLAYNVHVFCNADSPLVGGDTDTPTTTAQNHSQFLVQLLHSASVCISLRPFETGRADDVTGVMHIARGPACKDLQVAENEYLYLVGDTNVKLFFR